MNTQNDVETDTEDITSQPPIDPFKPSGIFHPGVPFAPTTSVEDIARGIDTGHIRILTFGVPPL